MSVPTNSKMPIPVTSAKATQGWSTFFQRIAQYKSLWYLLIVVLVCSAIYGWYRYRMPVKFDNQAQINLGMPDVWLHSQNLALLPHDLLQQPLLKSLLTEDFLYFYQQDVDWLSLQGALRRLSFEHNLNFSDTLLKDVASAPTDVYLWHDGTHTLRYWAISIERDQLLTLAQQLAQLKLVADKQITEVGRVTIDGDDVPLLQINLSAQRSMILVAHRKRLVLFSDSTMLTRDEGELDPHADSLLRSLLSNDTVQRPQLITGDQAPIMTTEHKQTIWLSNRFYAQGYASFLPDVQALRFDYDGTVWSSQADVRRVNPDPQIWAQIPAYAASCLSTSVDWSQAEAALKSADAPVDNLLTSKALESLAPTGAVCWFAEDGDDIAQPLFVALRTPHTTIKAEDLQGLFDWGISHNRDYEKPLLQIKAQKRDLADQLVSLRDELKTLRKDHHDASNKGKSEDEIAQDEKTYEDAVKSKKDEISQTETQQSDLTDQLNAAKKTLAPQEQKAHALTVATVGQFTTLARTQSILSQSNPMLAYNTQVIYFSPSSSLVQRAMSVAEKRYPNLQEATKVIDPHKNTLLYANPAKLAQLFTQTGQQALPQDSDKRLRAAFDYHMPSRMNALAQHKPFAVSVENPMALSSESLHWQPLNWRSEQ